MATVAQLNYVKVLLKKCNLDPEEYTLTEDIPHKLISGLIENLRDGVVEDSTEWNSRVQESSNSSNRTDVAGVSGAKYDRHSFDAEISFISIPLVKAFLRKMLDNVPEYFFRVPASSTGKYHPDIALGEGGLIRHTKAAILVAKSLFDNPSFELSQRDKDVIIAALILHDSCKHGLIEDKYTKHEHPLLVRELWKAHKETLDLSGDSAIIDEILDCIESHMGPWSTNKYSKVELPKPSNKLAKLVHLSDYIASRKFMSLNT